MSQLGKIKLYELAKDLNLTSKELLDKVEELGIKVKSHLSSLEDEEIEKIKNSLLKVSHKKSSQKMKNDKKQKDAPVIIRREVIVEDESKKQDEEKKSKQTQNKNPFVQRNQNKDYNIVYRNRPEKPKTVSELFGLNKDKNKNQKEGKKMIKNKM